MIRACYVILWVTQWDVAMFSTRCTNDYNYTVRMLIDGTVEFYIAFYHSVGLAITTVAISPFSNRCARACCERTHDEPACRVASRR